MKRAKDIIGVCTKFSSVGMQLAVDQVEAITPPQPRKLPPSATCVHIHNDTRYIPGHNYTIHTGVGTIQYTMVKDCHLPSPMLVPIATLAATFCASGATLTARKVRCQLGTLHLHWTLVSTTPVHWTLCTGHCALDTGHLYPPHTCVPPSFQTMTTA